MPRLHVVTDDSVLARPDFADAASALLEEGGANLALHLRSKYRPGADLQRMGEILAPVATRCGARLIVNERLDVALACGAAGAHLGERAMTSERARSFLGPDLLLGRSVHDIGGAVTAGQGTDYVFLGTIYPSASHATTAPLGLRVLAQAAAGSSLPVFAIGGVRIDRIREVMAAGAAGAAMISAIWDARDSGLAVREAMRALRDHAEGTGE